jgi:hypothetical protein
MDNFEYTALDIQKIFERNKKTFSITKAKKIFSLIEQTPIITAAKTGKTPRQQMTLLLDTLEKHMRLTRLL